MSATDTRAKELAAEKRATKKRAAGENAVREAIAEKIHELVTTCAPDLWPKTWYGMPAYARDGKVICFFQAAGKFDARCATLHSSVRLVRECRYEGGVYGFSRYVS